MKELIKKLKTVRSVCCVSIILNTHRTRPDNLQDPILLKNLIKEAEERLAKDYDKRFIEQIEAKLKTLVDSIDHDQNLDSMAIFVNENLAECVRLPIKVENRVVIDESFAIRDLVRATHESSSYYVLVLSRDKARLIEAHNDQVTEEISGVFPIANDTFFTADKLEKSMAKGSDNLIEEFFNRVDKEVQKIHSIKPLPIVVATETRNFDHYMKVADNKQIIVGHINRNRDDEKAHHIIIDAWEFFHNFLHTKQQERIVELKQAVCTGRFLSDFNDIWKAINEGRGLTLFVKRGLFQPAIIEGNSIKLVSVAERKSFGVVDDIIDEMIELNIKYGGDTVFVAGDELSDFQGLALITRY